MRHADGGAMFTRDDLHELTGLVEDAGLQVIGRAGLSFSPVRGFRISEDLTLDYFLAVTHR